MTPAGFRFRGGEHFKGGRPHRGSGGPSPPDAKLSKICKKSSENCKKCIILANFSTFFKNHAFNFRAFGRKIQMAGKILRNFWKKTQWEKMIFLLFLEKLLLKIEPWKITSDFYNNFSDFGGGGRRNVPVSPPPAPMRNVT